MAAKWKMTMEGVEKETGNTLKLEFGILHGVGPFRFREYEVFEPPS